MGTVPVPVSRGIVGYSRLSLIPLLLLATACAHTAQTPAPRAEATAGPASPAAAMPDDPVSTPGPAERVWQIDFMLGITEGLDGDLLAALEERYGPPDGNVPSVPEISDYQGAGYRIASAETLLAGLADLAAYRQAAQAELLEERAAMAAVATLDVELLAEEVLLVRSAALDSLETLATQEDWPAEHNAGYRVGTQRARNELEYIAYARDMDALAERAIGESTGRLDAFHRMMNDTEDTAFLRERVIAAEEMNRQLSDEHRDYATRRTVRTLLFMLPAISSYFRYR